eukprot:3925396-Pyramimonas_sp.AAC.1
MDMINRVTARTWREGHGTTPQGWPLSPPAGMATSPAGTTPWPRVCAPSSPHLVLTFVLLRSLASHHRPPPQAHTSKPRASDPQPRYTGIQVYRYTLPRLTQPAPAPGRCAHAAHRGAMVFASHTSEAEEANGWSSVHSSHNDCPTR